MRNLKVIFRNEFVVQIVRIKIFDFESKIVVIDFLFFLILLF